MKLFLQKIAKFSSAGGGAARPPCLRRLGALPPNPQPPTAGGFAPDPLDLWRLGASPPDPQNSPPLSISGYAPDSEPFESTRLLPFESQLIKIKLLYPPFACKLSPKHV